MGNVIQLPGTKPKLKKTGRPRKANPRSSVSYVRTTELDRKRLEDLAEACHLSVPDYLRAIIGFAIAEEWKFMPVEQVKECKAI